MLFLDVKYKTHHPRIFGESVWSLSTNLTVPATPPDGEPLTSKVLPVAPNNRLVSPLSVCAVPLPVIKRLSALLLIVTVDTASICVCIFDVTPSKKSNSVAVTPVALKSLA